MRIAIATSLLIVLSSFIYGQKFDPRIADTRQALSEVELLTMPPLNNQSLLEAELERRGPGIAPRFAETFEVDIRPETHGHWEQLANGKAVWRLRLLSKDAHSLNLGFTKYYMPPNGSLIIYTPDRKRVLGPFTPADNEVHEQLWTPVFAGDELVIEVQVPAQEREALDLHLTSINHDFLGFSSVVSGSCNLDVICGSADGWAIVDLYRDIIQSVAVISTGGSTFCTGFLVNNTRNDCTPYFMTADHCGLGPGAAPSLVAFWNYQNSDCRQPNTPQSGGAGDGTLNDFNTGAIHRASWSNADFTLVELDDEVSETANAFFAGWSRETFAPQDTIICVHHPSTDEKRISFELDGTTISDINGNNMANGNYVKVADWDIGTTEGGSSGAPLFNSDHLIVGQLFGGLAACGNNEYDVFGWFRRSWTGGGSSNSRLSDWLDPDDTGVITLDGRWQTACNFVVSPTPTQQEICAQDEAVFELTISEFYTGPVTITLDGVPGGATATLSANPVNPGEETTLTISNTGAVPSGNYTIQITGADADNSGISQVILSVVDTAPASTTLLNPTNGESGVSIFLSLNWTATSGATSYDIQVATDIGFTDIFLDGTDLMNTSLEITNLSPQTTYFWRVRGINTCGPGEWSTPFSFETGSCSGGSAVDVPLILPSVGEPTTTSEIEVSAPGFIESIQVVNVDVTHSYVGDLTMVLTAPTGDNFLLMERPGNPASYFGCGGENLLLNFADDAPNTADDLENTCNDMPAISGTFQSIDELAPLLGEEAVGTWTLSISDAADQDGGVLNGWALEICTAFPSGAVLSPSVAGGVICSNDDFSFELIVGAGFTGPVTLAAENVPANGSVVFSENPANPGSTVNVTISGAISEGNYIISFTGNDNTNNVSTDIDLSVNEGPAPFAGISPADGATEIPQGVLLSWENSDGATDYNLVVATNPALTDLFLDVNTAGNSFNLANLELSTTYYWQVEAINECGSTLSDIFSFSTQADLSLNVQPTTLNVCQSESPNLTIQVGNDFNSPASLSSTISPDAPDLNIDYDQEEDNLNGGDEVVATLQNLNTLPKGTYTITFTIDDGTNSESIEVTLNLSGAPDFPDLQNPANGSILMNPTPAFSWTEATDADGYTIEIATDDLFTNIVESINAGNSTSITLTDPLAGGLYFWRVVSNNECGNSTTAAFSFDLQVSSVNELNGRTVSFLPNPTSDRFQIRFSDPLPGDLRVEIFAVNGQILQKQLFGGGETVEVDLAMYSSGVYLVRLSNGEGSMSKRVVLKK